MRIQILFVILFSLTWTTRSQPLESSHEKKQLNILFIVVDDLRPQLGCYGDTKAITPNMDKLAAQGVLFNRAYCQQAVCSPSRSSVLTGLRPNTVKVWDLKTHFRQALPDVVTLPQYFKQHGYHTQAIGKIYHGSKSLQDERSWSVDETFVTDQPGKYAKKENILKSAGFYKAASTERADVADTAYTDGKAVAKAIEALRLIKDKPFFLAVGLLKPHLPFAAPEKFWGMHDPDELPFPDDHEPTASTPVVALHSSTELRGYTDIPETGPLTPEKMCELIHGYYACTSFTDHLIGKLVAEMKSLKLTDNTIVVLLGDHGFHLGEHNLWCKTTNFELDTRVPLIISAPGKKAGVKSEALVELVDLYPTLAELTGLRVPKKLEGTSMAPLLDKADLPWKSAVFSQFPRPWFYKENPEIMGYSVRTDRFRYTEWKKFQTGEVVARELYDHQNDSDENVNLSEQKEFNTIRIQLSKKLEDGWTKAMPALD